MYNFQTGIFKEKQKPGDMLKFFANPTGAQLNFLHELSSQHLGHPPSHFWGNQVIPWKFQGVPREVFHYVREASRQPKHEFQRRMLDNTSIAKHASGWVNTARHVIQDAVEAGTGYVNQAAAFMARHQTTIDSAGQLINIGASLGTLGGLIAPSTADKIHSATNRVMTQPTRTQPTPKSDLKGKGSGWVDYT